MGSGSCFGGMGLGEPWQVSRGGALINRALTELTGDSTENT